MQARFVPGRDASWEEIEMWLRSRHGRLPMLIIFENSEEALMEKESAKVGFNEGMPIPAMTLRDDTKSMTCSSCMHA